MNLPFASKTFTVKPGLRDFGFFLPNSSNLTFYESVWHSKFCLGVWDFFWGGCFGSFVSINRYVVDYEFTVSCKPLNDFFASIFINSLANPSLASQIFQFQCQKVYCRHVIQCKRDLHDLQGLWPIHCILIRPVHLFLDTDLLLT